MIDFAKALVTVPSLPGQDFPYINYTGLLIYTETVRRCERPQLRAPALKAACRLTAQIVTRTPTVVIAEVDWLKAPA